MTKGDQRMGIKLGTHVSADCADDELLFLRQLGVEHVRVHFAVDQDDPGYVGQVCERFRAAGIEIYSVVYMLYQAREIAFALPGREEIFRRFARFVRTMGDHGLHTLEYDFFLYAPLPVTGEALTRHCPTRSFDIRRARALPPAVDHTPTPEEMWSAYEDFMEAILPVAASAGVRLALHPDDPPVPHLLGVPRLFADIAGLSRAMRHFDSPFWGILFCVGTWAEGGTAMGMELCEAIRFFAERGKLFTVHLRNVTSPLPAFAETFLDNGYVDMAEVMHTLVDTGFDGLVIPDHFPALTGDAEGRASLAYALGVMRGLLSSAERSGFR